MPYWNIETSINYKDHCNRPDQSLDSISRMSIRPSRSTAWVIPHYLF